MKHPFYSDDAAVGRETQKLLDNGVSILQIWKYGTTDREHCEWLLKLAQFKLDAHVLDIGCGTGAVAWEMRTIRVDLKFSCQNISPSQLQLCSTPTFPRYLGNMTTLDGVPDNTFDAAMVCYALGHVENVPTFFDNVARVLKPEGKLFIYDILAKPGFSQWMRNVLNYETYTVELLAELSGPMLLTHNYELNTKDFNVDEFDRVCGYEIAWETQQKTKPVAYQFVKRSE